MRSQEAEIDFPLEDLVKIEQGKKTQFRRPCPSDLFFIDNGTSGLVEPCRGYGGVNETGHVYGSGLFMLDYRPGQELRCSGKPQIRIKITEIYVQKLGDIQSEEIKREGFDSMESFLNAWKCFYGTGNAEERVVVYCFQKSDALMMISHTEIAALCGEMQDLFAQYSPELSGNSDINDARPSFTLKANDCVFLIDRIRRTVPIDFYTMVLAVKQTMKDHPRSRVFGVLLTRNAIDFRSKFLFLWQKHYISFLPCDALAGFIKEKLQAGSVNRD